MFWGGLGGVGCFDEPHNGYAYSLVKIKFANEVASRYR